MEDVPYKASTVDEAATIDEAANDASPSAKIHADSSGENEFVQQLTHVMQGQHRFDYCLLLVNEEQQYFYSQSSCR